MYVCEKKLCQEGKSRRSKQVHLDLPASQTLCSIFNLQLNSWQLLIIFKDYQIFAKWLKHTIELYDILTKLRYKPKILAIIIV